MDLTWTSSLLYCKEHGGHLAHVTSQEELDNLAKVIVDVLLEHGHAASYEIWWVGAHRNTDGAFEWTDGTILPNDSPLWYEGEPNSVVEEAVSIMVNHEREDGLNDLNDDANVRFICEKELG